MLHTYAMDTFCAVSRETGLRRDSIECLFTIMITKMIPIRSSDKPHVMRRIARVRSSMAGFQRYMRPCANQLIMINSLVDRFADQYPSRSPGESARILVYATYVVFALTEDYTTPHEAWSVIVSMSFDEFFEEIMVFCEVLKFELMPSVAQFNASVSDLYEAGAGYGLKLARVPRLWQYIDYVDTPVSTSGSGSEDDDDNDDDDEEDVCGSTEDLENDMYGLTLIMDAQCFLSPPGGSPTGEIVDMASPDHTRGSSFAPFDSPSGECVVNAPLRPTLIVPEIQTLNIGPIPTDTPSPRQGTFGF
jgi:hypothetical protein